ncbi:hypothetical protein NUW54_g13765 [Trametes sanguinea]|uniref:Uncharacterized protein n=1 Tax=Trametes sanguinea TaxID=158606 RepID=A0ACC1MJQ9_9APHY|nr:hypothetical protein NUW54_g13765 [Trametes sanguinea]
MAPLRGWLVRAKAGGARHISLCGDEQQPVDIPPFLLPLDLRVKLSDSHSAPRRASLHTVLSWSTADAAIDSHSPPSLQTSANNELYASHHFLARASAAERCLHWQSCAQ